MSDDDEQVLNKTDDGAANSRRLAGIKSKLHALTREKNRYNTEKLKQDEEFLKSEIRHLRQAVHEVNEVINDQAKRKRNLNAEMTNFKSRTGLRYPSLNLAIKDKEKYRKELAKVDKSETYKNLAQQNIASIDAAIPDLQKLEEYKAHLRQAEEYQEHARKRRELLEETLKQKLQKHVETQQLLSDSKSKLPEIEKAITDLRNERDRITGLMRRNKPRSQTSDSVQSRTMIIERNQSEIEQNSYQEQLEKIVTLKNYFREKMIEHQMNPFQLNDATPTSQLIPPLFQSILSIEDDRERSPSIRENITPSESPSTGPPTNAVAIRLPRKFAPLEFQSTTTNEIIHSPHCQDKTIEYKKELPADIVNKYAGMPKRGKQQIQSPLSNASNSKRNRKNRKNFGMKHSQQIITLYNEVRTALGNSDMLPPMPMFEYELSQAIQSLEMVEESIKSYLNEIFKRDHSCFSVSSRDELENESARDSVLDTFSETSSMIEPVTTSKGSSIPDQIFERIVERSSSSSDDKKTVVSSSSAPSSHHSYPKVDFNHVLGDPLSTVNESSLILGNQPQSNQIERQISDEGYRSVPSERQRSTLIDQSQMPLIQSLTYDSTEKVGQWLTNSTSTMISSLNINPSIETLATHSNDQISEFTATNHSNHDEDISHTIEQLQFEKAE